MVDAKYVDMKKINVGVRDDEKFIDLSEIDIGFSMAEFQKILDERKRTLRALWLARAERASSEKAHYYIMSTNCEPHSNKQKWMKRIAFTWENVERKCREYSERFK